MIIAKNAGGSNYEPLAAGSYAARCYSMIEIGTNEETILGKVKNLHKVRISWELPTETKVFKEENGEQPHVVSKEFTLSLHEKATLRKFLESWRGKAFTEQEAEAFDITKLLGVECMLSIIHKTSGAGKVYVDISGVSKLPKGMECPAPVNERQELSFSEWKQDLFESLPSFIKEKIMTSEEYNAMDFEEETEEIPF